MRQIDGLYAQRYDHLRKNDGSLFRGRYKVIVMDEHSYLLQVSRCVHRNPIELRMPLVTRLEVSTMPFYTLAIRLALASHQLFNHALMLLSN